MENNMRELSRFDAREVRRLAARYFFTKWGYLREAEEIRELGPKIDRDLWHSTYDFIADLEKKLGV
jgi:hypothetical protein